MTRSQCLSSRASGRTLGEVIDDPERLAAVAGTALIEDGRPDPVLYRLARQARRVLDVPTVFLSVLDDERQYFAAADGLSASLAPVGFTPLSHAFLTRAWMSAWRAIPRSLSTGWSLMSACRCSRLSANRSALCARPTSSRGSGALSKSACCTTSLRRPRYASTSEQLNDRVSADDC